MRGGAAGAIPATEHPACLVEELDRHRREGLTSVSGTAVTWHPLLIAGTAALTVAAVLSLALPHG